MGDRKRFRKWINLIENSHGQTASYFFVDHFYKFLNETVLNGMDEKEVEQTKFDINALVYNNGQKTL